MVASMVILVIMVSLAYVMTSSLKAVSFAKQRQTANALMDMTMEEVRALPYATTGTGMDNTDISTSADPNITGSGPYIFAPNGETLVSGTLSSAAGATPLYPHHRTSTGINHTTYTVATYIARYLGVTSAFRVTVIVSWVPSVVRGLSNQVSTQTVVVSPSAGCLSAATHPFAAPCQPFLYAQATSGKGAIAITPPVGYPGTAITDPNNGQSVALQQAELAPAWDDSTMQIEQVSNESATGQTGQGLLSVAGELPRPAEASSARSSLTTIRRPQPRQRQVRPA